MIISLQISVWFHVFKAQPRPYVPFMSSHTVHFTWKMLNTATQDVPLLSAAQIQHAYFQVQCLERHLATIPSWFLSSSSYNFFPDAQLLACVSPCRRHSPGRTSLYTQPHDGWLWRCARTHTIVPKPQKSQIIILIWAWEWFKMCVCACVRALNIFTCTHKRTLQMVIRNWLRSNISE